MNKTRSARWIYQVSTAVALAFLVNACASTPGTNSNSVSSDSADEQGEHSGMLLRYCNKLYDAKDLYVAASMCRRAYTINPTDPAPLYTLAEIYGEMGATESKAEAYRLALQIDPDDIEALYGLGKTSIDLGRYEIAVAQIERAISLDPGDARFYNAMGVAKDQLGQHNTAQTLYREGLSIDPDNVSLRNNLGLSLSLSGKHQQSVAMLREVAKEPSAGVIGSKNLALAATNAAKPGPDMAMDGPMAEADGDPMSLTSPAEEMGIAMGDDAMGQDAKGQDAMGQDAMGEDAMAKAGSPDGENAEQAPMAAAMAKPMPQAMDGEPDEISEAMDDTAVQDQSGAIGSSSVSVNDTEQGAAEQDAGASMPTSAFTSSSSSVPTPEKIRSSTAESGQSTATQIAAASASTSYTVQVGSYGSEKSAERGWGIISDTAQDILSGVQHSIVQADLGSDRGMVYRLRTGSVADKASADKLCAELSDRDIGCFVVRLPEATAAPVAASKAKSPSGESATTKEPMGEDSES